MKRRKTYWRICVILVITLTVLGYTPVIIPSGVYKPTLLGIPYSLWTSCLITVALVVLTYIGSKVHPGNDHKEGDS
jgi:uncharacterized membrane protein YqaE (UPF0057 family)